MNKEMAGCIHTLAAFKAKPCKCTYALRNWQ